MVIVDGIFCDYCDNWFWIGVNLVLEIQYVQVMYVGVILIIVVIVVYFLVVVCVKCFIVFVGQNNYVYVVVVMGICQCLNYFFDG